MIQESLATDLLFLYISNTSALDDFFFSQAIVKGWTLWLIYFIASLFKTGCLNGKAVSKIRLSEYLLSLNTPESKSFCIHLVLHMLSNTLLSHKYVQKERMPQSYYNAVEIFLLSTSSLRSLSRLSCKCFLICLALSKLFPLAYIKISN